MAKSFDGKVVIVTGANSGIGEESASTRSRRVTGQVLSVDGGMSAW
jgi:NAD(P)-dependent dehydrogenase (short-subunit alcohol dehydrogenase family)